MNKICTSLEQSKKLIELGIDVSTADIFWYRKLDGTHILKVDDVMLKLDTPAWSLSALLRLMPFQIIKNNQRYGFYSLKGFNSQGETYCFEYKTNTGNSMFETYYWNNPIDAAFEMVVWLKENVLNHINI